MTSNEFVAWLEGFLDGIDGDITPEQAVKIVEKAKTIRSDQVIPWPDPVYPNYPIYPGINTPTIPNPPWSPWAGGGKCW